VELEGEDESDSRSSIGERLAILFVPVLVTARVLNHWLPLPVAWGSSFFLWMMLIYWFPSRSGMSFKRWLIVASGASLIAVLVAIISPDWI